MLVLFQVHWKISVVENNLIVLDTKRSRPETWSGFRIRRKHSNLQDMLAMANSL